MGRALSRKTVQSHTMTRRQVMKLGAAAAMGAAASPLALSPATAESVNWQRYKGTTLSLLFYKHPWVDEIEKHFPEFESLTGMKIQHEVIPEVQGREKLVVQMAAGSGDIDAWHASMHVEKRRFWKSGWFQPLNDDLKDKNLTAEDYAWNDMAKGAVDAVTEPDKTISALPTFPDPFVLFYRKDLFDQKGWGPPKTLDELEGRAKQLHNPPNMYGFVMRGLKNANATPWAFVLFAMGGQYLTPDRKSAMNTPAWIKTMDWYAGMLRRYSPPGVVNFNWYECSAAFIQGQVAIYVDGVNFANQFEDPAKSKIAGKVGYAPLPAGPAGRFAPTFTNAMAVSGQSRHKEAAYLFSEWATSKANCNRELLAGVGVGRASTWGLPELKAKHKMPLSWYQAYLDSLKISRPGLPEIVDVTQYRDIIGVAIQKAIEGAKSADVIAEANTQFQEMLDKTEK
ncbi:MAG TPA: sugar ABC transporter substrate-binding protein [bacterium]|nr:sugar ABC transporter substrate-binding protein [bacterium]